MLTKTDNELLVRIGPKTPMGELFRRFWTPVMLASELGGPDSAPVRVRILGEDIVAFRDSHGRLGLLDAYCPHRRANLFWGRNEQDGLRCIYHGWKFDVTGQCTDLPNCPEGPNLKNKVKTTSYPAMERGGLIWAFMGPIDLMPEFPVPDDHRSITKMITRGNYAQLQEGDIDSSHVSFLHSRFDGKPIPGGRVDATVFKDRMPRWFTAETDYGLMLSAQRNASETEFHWRVNQYLMPYAVLIAAPPGGPVLTQVRVPIDDDHSMHFRVWSNADHPLTDEERAVLNDGITVPEVMPGTFTTKEEYENDYLIDRADQAAFSFTGIKSIVAQDLAVTQDQGGFGTIADRSREYLTSSDKAIIALRKRLLTAAKNLMKGQEPPEPRNARAYSVRPGDFKLPRDTTVAEGARDLLLASVR
jgi:phenylpropionate dioxygenase-like ring-hydroxylating dioxygenase large terminal subunit